MGFPPHARRCRAGYGRLRTMRHVNGTSRRTGAPLVRQSLDASLPFATMSAAPAVRPAELLAGLSLATDLAAGQPHEHGMRACILALRLADSLGLARAERETVFDVA